MRSFITWLFNLDPNKVGADSELSIRFNQAPEGWMVFLVIVAVIAFAVWIYYRDGRGTASPFFRGFLGVLRAALIAIGLFILTEPVLLATADHRRRVVAFPALTNRKRRAVGPAEGHSTRHHAGGTNPYYEAAKK